MSTSPSFERFDYLLRTNKHIERKLVFDVLYSASQVIDFSEHWYLGLGSMWFGDFRLAHRLLGIDRLVSIEHSDHAPRAEYNRPFAGVRVEAGECGEVLQRFSTADWSKPVVAWLDYDGHLSTDIVSDIDTLVTRAQPNSAIIITVNGARGTYRVRRAGGITARADTSVGVVESFLGATSIPARFQPQQNGAGAYGDVSETEFPEFLTEAMTTFMQHRVVSSARQEGENRLRFVPLYRLHHRDGADMVTVGGALVSGAEASPWERCLANHPILRDSEDKTAYTRLDLVPVTVKEKIALDACLPDPSANEQYIALARETGLKLGEEEIRKYRKFYRHFPVFVESSM